MIKMILVVLLLGLVAALAVPNAIKLIARHKTEYYEAELKD